MGHHDAAGQRNAGIRQLAGHVVIELAAISNMVDGLIQTNDFDGPFNGLPLTIQRQTADDFGA